MLGESVLGVSAMSIAKQPLPDIESGADVTLSPSPHNRAADYRVHARKLRELARGEPFGGVRAQLLGLALQYQGLAKSLEASTGLNWSVVRYGPWNRKGT